MSCYCAVTFDITVQTKCHKECEGNRKSAVVTQLLKNHTAIPSISYDRSCFLIYYARLGLFLEELGPLTLSNYWKVCINSFPFAVFVMLGSLLASLACGSSAADRSLDCRSECRRAECMKLFLINVYGLHWIETSQHRKSIESAEPNEN